MMIKIGIIINPIAGMGGKVGLKGTDGSLVLEEAIKRGATPISPGKSIQFFNSLKLCPSLNQIRFYVPPGDMGENSIKVSGIQYTLVDYKLDNQTSANDTTNIAKIMITIPVDVILFFGGDGTARDVYRGVKSEVPILGIPSGVKIHSGIFTKTIYAGTDLICELSLLESIECVSREIIDLDEISFRKDKIVTKIYGIASVPFSQGNLQVSKSISNSGSESDNIDGIMNTYKEQIRSDVIYILGSGSTLKVFSKIFGIEKNKTVLGIDIVKNNQIIKKDANEEEILNIINKNEKNSMKLILTPIGGQGFLLGRGNLQLSPKVVRKVGLNNIDIISTRNKLNSLARSVLYVDTGDNDLDESFKKFWKVLIDYNEYKMIKIA